MFKVITFSDFLQHINPGHLLEQGVPPSEACTIVKHSSVDALVYLVHFQNLM